MASIEETLHEYDVVTEPEPPKETGAQDTVTPDDTEMKENEHSLADTSANDDTDTERKKDLRDSYHLQTPPVEILCPKVNCQEKIVRTTAHNMSTVLKNREGIKTFFLFCDKGAHWVVIEIRLSTTKKVNKWNKIIYHPKY